MSDSQSSVVQQQFRDVLDKCRRLYLDAGREIAEQYPELIEGGTPSDFVAMMDELHKALLVKVFARLVEADRRSSPEKMQLAETLVEHLWQERLTGDQLRSTLRYASHQASGMMLYSLLRPFDQIAPLRNRIGDLITIVMRLANLVAKADGTVSPEETNHLRSLQRELETHLVPIPIDEPGKHEDARQIGSQAIQQSRTETSQLRSEASRGRPSAMEAKEEKTAQKVDQEELERLLAEAKKNLERMVGLSAVKKEIETLTNFLRLQQHREKAGLPKTRLSLHMVFVGNPGTGKTTVARIVGQIFRGLGILEKGHLVETDRSGLVAEYVGQTAPKTNKIINQAMDGVLFIDEAYALVAERSDDAYGREALQTLLKRMEDDRERLVIVMAGYPEPMERLLKVNPGLSSRINNQLLFEDYNVVELCQIFQAMCDQNHYRIPQHVRVKLVLGFQWLHAHRDERFGNGRLVRNVFETAIRRLANRIAGVAPITTELLTLLDAQDIDLPDVPDSVFADLNDSQRRFRVACPECGKTSRTRAEHFGRHVQCPTCRRDFVFDWAEPVEPALPE